MDFQVSNALNLLLLRKCQFVMMNPPTSSLFNEVNFSSLVYNFQNRVLFTIITSNSPKISEESTISNSPLPPRSMPPAPFPTSSSGERSQSKKSSSHLGNGFPSLWELGKRVLKGDISTSTTLSSSQNPSSTLASVVNHKVQHQVDSLSSSSSKLKSPMKIVLEDTE